MSYFKNIDRFGNEIINSGATDVNLIPISTVPTPTGNTTNLNSIVIDPNGNVWFIDSNGDAIEIGGNNVSIKDTLANGNLIGTITIEGVDTPIKETITTLTKNGTVFTYTSEDGTETIIDTTPLDVNLTTISFVPTATGNTTNLNSLVVDPNGDIWVIDFQGDAKKLNIAPQLNVLTTAQPTPTTTGNTTNLNTAFKDTLGNTWIVDSNGDAVQAGTTPFKNLNEWHVDPNGSDTTGDGSQEKPFKTITKALTLAGQGDEVIVHAGVYTENITISTPNVALVGAQSEYGSLTQINGSVSVTASGTSVKISDIGMTSLSDTGTGDLYLNSVTVTSTLSSTAGYLEIKNSSIQDGTITKSGGSMLIEQTKIDNVNVTGTNTAVFVRNSYQDANSTISYGAGTIYSVQNVQGGEVSINASAIPLETAALAQGLTAEMAKEAETADFMKLGMLRPDTEAAPTKVVTWDEVTGRLEISSLSSINNGAPVTVGTNPPTGTSIEGAIHLVTDDGTPTGTVLEQYIYDTESGTWIQMMRNAQDMIKFGTAAPTGNGSWDGEEYFVTSTGTSAGTVTEQWIWDKQTATWVKRPSVITKTTTSLTPQYGNGTTHVNAQANAETTIADVIKLSDGSLVNNEDIVTWTGHGLTLHAWYYLDPTTPGGYTTVPPIAPNYSQRLFYVVDANTVKVNVQEAQVVNGNTVYAPETRSYATGTTSTAHNTLVDVAGSSITLQPGTYILGYDVHGSMENNGNGTMWMAVRMSTSGNVDVGNSNRNFVTAGYVTGFSGSFAGSASFHSEPITITTATTYKLRMNKFSAGGTPNTGQTFAVSPGSYIYAQKLA